MHSDPVSSRGNVLIRSEEMLEMKRNTLITLWFLFAAVATICCFVFLIHAICSEDVYENCVVATMNWSAFIGLFFAILQSVLGRRVAKGEKNWSKVVNNLVMSEMTLTEWAFLISYVIFGTMLFVMWMSWMLAFFGRHIGL